jgi:predicted DNA-binding transcriptional regulator YafY
MNDIEKHIECISHIHFLVKNRMTGGTSDLASRLNISKRKVERYIKYMKENGAPIIYCHKSRSYYYEFPVDFKHEFK